jgi:hypothetical protein
MMYLFARLCPAIGGVLARNLLAVSRKGPADGGAEARRQGLSASGFINLFNNFHRLHTLEGTRGDGGVFLEDIDDIIIDLIMIAHGSLVIAIIIC